EARRREALLSRYVFLHHSAFRDTARFWADFTDPEHGIPTIEGGDVLVASRELLLVGLTQRTNKAAIRRLAKSLKEANAGVETIIVVELPKQRSFMHLDT